MKTLVPMLFALVLCLSSGLAFAKDYDVIRFGVDPTYAPFASKATDGALVGFEIDIGNALCAHLKVKCKWVESDFDAMIPSLNSGKIDAILASMAVTPAREKVIDFSSEVFSSPTALLFKKGAALDENLDMAKGKSVGYLQGSIQEVYATRVLTRAGLKAVAYPDQDQVYADLISGRLIASIQDSLQARMGFMRTAQGAEFEMGKPIESDLLPSKSAIGIAKGNEALKALIDQGLAALHTDGTYERLQTKYFGDINLFSGK